LPPAMFSQHTLSSIINFMTDFGKMPGVSA